MPKTRSVRSKKRQFHGNRFTSEANEEVTAPQNVESASSKKLKTSQELVEHYFETNSEEYGDNRIVSLTALISLFSMVCCPDCFSQGLKLVEDSVTGLCSNMVIKCKHCAFLKAFPSTGKHNNSAFINSYVVLGLRLIGKGFSAGKKLCSFLGLPFLSKLAFRNQEKKLLSVVELCAEENTNSALAEIKSSNDDVFNCGISVDGTWQRRGYSSLNGCVSAMSIDTGKILDIEVMSQYCRICSRGQSTSTDHVCANYNGSAGNMEVVGAKRIFERSNARNVQYNEYYGDGDSKGYEGVKNFYEVDSVTKLECIGHVQKRVGGRLRQLKKVNKSIGGKGKLTDKLIDRIQNYYGIALRSNVGNLQNMKSAVIAAFFHSVSGSSNPLHGQCPEGAESWCRFQRAKASGSEITEKKPGLPNNIINDIKPTYLKLCDESLLSKCLHGKTQNCNESYNNMLWNILPKKTFIELETFRLGAFFAVILFNSGYSGLLPVFAKAEISLPESLVHCLVSFDELSISTSTRHSLQSTKLSRKKLKAHRKTKCTNDGKKEGLVYSYGGF